MQIINSNPLVSWVLCTNNFNNALLRAVDSCLNQNYRNFEIVIVANGPDSRFICNELEKIYKDNHLIRIYCTNIYYLNFSLSLALHYSKGEFIARMDADDISETFRISSQVDFMLKNPDVSILGGSFRCFNLLKNEYDIYHEPMSHDQIKRKFYFKNAICHPTVMFRKEVIEKIGGYLGGLYSEDYDLWLRLLLKKDIIFANLNTVLITYNNNPTEARLSKLAYANAAAAQFRNFALTYNLMWLIACFITIAKVIIYSKKNK